jgi:hypothetical protein
MFRKIRLPTFGRGCRGEYGVSFLPMEPGAAILYPSHSRSLRTRLGDDGYGEKKVAKFLTDFEMGMGQN